MVFWLIWQMCNGRCVLIACVKAGLYRKMYVQVMASEMIAVEINDTRVLVAVLA